MPSHEHDSARATGHGGLTLHDYLQVLRRRKWAILFAVVLVQFLAVLLTLSESKVYQATAQVLLSRQSLASSLNGLQDPTLSVQPDPEGVSLKTTPLFCVPPPPAVP